MNLTECYGLFVSGMMVGGLLSAMPFMIGRAIGWLCNLMKKG